MSVFSLYSVLKIKEKEKIRLLNLLNLIDNTLP